MIQMNACQSLKIPWLQITIVFAGVNKFLFYQPIKTDEFHNEKNTKFS